MTESIVKRIDEILVTSPDTRSPLQKHLGSVASLTTSACLAVVAVKGKTWPGRIAAGAGALTTGVFGLNKLLVERQN